MNDKIYSISIKLENSNSLKVYGYNLASVLCYQKDYPINSKGDLNYILDLLENNIDPTDNSGIVEE